MAEPTTILPVDEGFPELHVPLIFSDGVISLTPSQGIVKFYLARTEPNFMNLKEHKIQPCAQIVMTTHSFAQTVAFFETVTKVLIERGSLTQEQMDQARAAVPKPPPE